MLTTTGALVGVQYADALGGSQPAANQLPTWLAKVTPTGQQGPATLSQLTHSPGYLAARPSVKANLLGGGTTTVSCGQVIKASMTFTSSLLCPGNAVALTLAGAKVTLNLNGFGVYSDGVNQAGSGSVGILVTGSTDTLEKGAVFGFDSAAVAVNGSPFGAAASTDTVTNMLANYSSGNGIYVGLFAGKVTVSNSTAVYNGQAGFFDEGGGTTLTGNHAAGNYTGFDIEGYHSTVKSNTATDNGQSATPYGYYSAGFFILASTTMTGNTATNNFFLGMDNYGGSAIDGGGNVAHGNDFYTVTNPPNYPIQCRGITCG